LALGFVTVSIVRTRKSRESSRPLGNWRTSGGELVILTTPWYAEASREFGIRSVLQRAILTTWCRAKSRSDSKL